MKILIISGCNIEYTPVVSSYIKYLKLKNQEVTVVELKKFFRFDFIWRSIYSLLKEKYLKIIFINFQSIPIILIAELFGLENKIYWKLESYSAFENWSIVLKLQILEWLVNKKTTSLIVPTLQRLKIQKPVFNNSYILPNAPLNPYINKNTKLINNSININLIIYGNASSPSDIYIFDWVSLIQFKPSITLEIIGQTGESKSNVKFFNRISHTDLIALLLSNRFHYSIVGYRNINKNTLFAAPNKLIESLACGIPIIGNINNPYVSEIVNIYKCGILLDFDNLNLNMLIEQLSNYEKHSDNALVAANDLCLKNQINNTPLGIN